MTFGHPLLLLSLLVIPAAVAAYRLVQYWMTLPIGGIAYVSLRYGPWSITRARRLERLRRVAAEAAASAEHRLSGAASPAEHRLELADRHEGTVT